MKKPMNLTSAVDARLLRKTCGPVVAPGEFSI